MSDVTQLLAKFESGDPRAAAELLPLVYDELRKLAAARMAQERSGHSLDATALVHEAYLRLIGDQQFDGRGHFFAAAAEAMRRILVNHARDRNRLKREGGRVRLELLDQAQSLSEDPDLVISLDQLLKQLAEEDTEAAKIAQLHLFGGLSIGQAGEVLGQSRATAYRNWKYARAWLRTALVN
ncbi:MAG: sigma-70 family RNA polymerase sigma factor [Planctomycetaceae bacterium]|nr:sigma-70 family RNA polymerase sigma factor [Planctomycetaceae bacterium]